MPGRVQESRLAQWFVVCSAIALQTEPEEFLIRDKIE